MFLGDRDEPCIIDDTSHFPRININSKRRAPGIRANTAQIAVLKKAYKQSNVLSSKEAKFLSEETTLPPKWILQWFGRQRSKERKNDVNSNPFVSDSASTTGSKQPSNSAAFSAAFFSESGSGAPATGNISSKEIMTIKLEYQDLTLVSTPSVSGSTSVEDFIPFSVSESSSMSTSVSGRLDMVDYEDGVIKIDIPGNGSEEDPGGGAKRNILHSVHRLNLASGAAVQTKSTDGACFWLPKLHLPDAAHGPKFSDDAHSGMIEPDTYAYTQPSPRSTSQEHHPLTPFAHRIYLPHIVPPQRSPIVNADIAARSFGEIKTRHKPSKLSVVNAPDSDISLHQGNSFSVPNSTAVETFSISQSQWYNNRFSMGVQSTLMAPETQIPEPVQYSKYLVSSSAVNRPSKANPLAAVSPNFLDSELVFMDRLTEAFHTNFPDLLSPFQDNRLTWMGPPPKRLYGQQSGIEAQPHPGTTVEYDPSVVNPDYLEALDPLRAPLKHLTGILTEYRDEDGTYLSLLDGLQDPAGRRRIIGHLANEELVSHDPFSAAMGLSLLSRLGVL